MLASSFIQNLQAADEQTNRVGTYDLRSEAPEFLQGRAAVSSESGLILLYLGSDADIFQVLMDASNELLREGIPINGIIAGTPLNTRTNDLEFYANVHWAGDMNTSQISTLKERVQSALRSSHQRFIIDGFVSKEALDGEPPNVFTQRNIGLQLQENNERIRVLERQQKALREHLDSLENQNC